MRIATLSLYQIIHDIINNNVPNSLYSFVPTDGIINGFGYSRGNSATIVDYMGDIVPVKPDELRVCGAKRIENLFTNTHDLTHGDWLHSIPNTQLTPVLDATPPPSGCTDAFALTDATTLHTLGTGYTVTLIPDTVYTVSIYVKKEIAVDNDRPAANVSFPNQGIYHMWMLDNVSGIVEDINGQTNVWSGYSAASHEPSVETIDSTWYRFKLSFTTPANLTGGSEVSFFASYAGADNNHGGNLAQGTTVLCSPQLEFGAVANEYVSKGMLSSPYHGAGVDGVKYVNMYGETYIVDTSYTSTIVAAQPMAYYPLNEQAGTFQDAMGNYPSTLDSLSTTERNYPALIHEGGYAPNVYDDYIRLGNWAPVKNITLEAWVKFSVMSSNDYGSIIAKKTNSTASCYQLTTKWGGGGLINFEIGTGVAGTRTNLSSTIALNDNQIHHIVATREGTEMRLYIDGVLDNSISTVPDEDLYVISTQAAIGEYGLGAYSSYDFKGQIDQVAIYDRAITAEEVEAHYAIGTSGVSAKVVDVEPYTLIEPVATNLIKDSGEFYSTTNSLGVTTEKFGYFNTAKLFEIDVPSGHRINAGVQANKASQVNGTIYTSSVYIKRFSGTREFFQITQGGNANEFPTINVSYDKATVVDIDGGSTYIGSSVEVLQDGWLRVSMVWRADTTNSDSVLIVSSIDSATAPRTHSFVGDMSVQWIVACPQIEEGSSATSYIPTSGGEGIRNADYMVRSLAGATLENYPTNMALVADVMPLSTDAKIFAINDSAGDSRSIKTLYGDWDITDVGNPYVNTDAILNQRKVLTYTRTPDAQELYVDDDLVSSTNHVLPVDTYGDTEIMTIGSDNGAYGSMRLYGLHFYDETIADVTALDHITTVGEVIPRVVNTRNDLTVDSEYIEISGAPHWTSIQSYNSVFAPTVAENFTDTPPTGLPSTTRIWDIEDTDTSNSEALVDSDYISNSVGYTAAYSVFIKKTVNATTFPYFRIRDNDDNIYMTLNTDSGYYFMEQSAGMKGVGHVEDWDANWWRVHLGYVAVNTQHQFVIYPAKINTQYVHSSANLGTLVICAPMKQRGVLRCGPYVPTAVATGPYQFEAEDSIDPYANSVVLYVEGENDLNDVTGKTVTVNGNTALTPSNKKIGTKSIYFDGSGDYLSVPASTDFGFGTGDFAIEAFVNILDSGVNILFDFRNGVNNSTIMLYKATGGILRARMNGVADLFSFTSNVINKWQHIALTRESGTLRLFVDGVLVGSTTANDDTGSSCPVAVGSDYVGSETLAGYMEQIRITKGVARYTHNFIPPAQSFDGRQYLPSYTPPTPPTDNTVLLIAGEHNLEDSKGHTVTVVGNTALSTEAARFGGKSIKFDGSGDQLSIVSSPDFGLGAGDWTVEGWVYLPVSLSTNDYIMDLRSGAGQEGGFRVTSTEKLSYFGSITIDAATTLSTERWYHFAFVRSVNTLAIYLDGQIDGTGDLTGLDFGADRPCKIGANYDDVGELRCYMEQIRITKGEALYTTNFTPPFEPFEE